MNEKIICPVCGLIGGVKEQPWQDSMTASQDICPCCGTHYGEDDWGQTKEQIKENHIKLRKKWIKEGMKWWSKDIKYNPQPKNWNPEEQLRNIPREYW